MSTGRYARIETGDGGARTLVLDRPPVNALGRDLVCDLIDAARALAEDEEARCLVVRSSGAHFCAGADLKERKSMTPEEVVAFVPRIGEACSALAAIPYPTIAAVRGTAAGGGCEVALACDLRILSEDARMGLRETALAILPGAGGTQRLPRIAGEAVAKRWIFTAKLHTAAEAFADGVADAVVPDPKLDEEAEALSALIRENGPVAVRLAKRAIEGGAALPLDRALALEWECYRGTLATEDRVEALRAFAEKRKPVFRGR